MRKLTSKSWPAQHGSYGHLLNQIFLELSGSRWLQMTRLRYSNQRKWENYCHLNAIQQPLHFTGSPPILLSGGNLSKGEPQLYSFCFIMIIVCRGMCPCMIRFRCKMKLNYFLHWPRLAFRFQFVMAYLIWWESWLKNYKIKILNVLNHPKDTVNFFIKNPAF